MRADELGGRVGERREVVPWYHLWFKDQYYRGRRLAVDAAV